MIYVFGARIAWKLLAERQTHAWKVASSTLSRSGRRTFLMIARLRLQISAESGGRIFLMIERMQKVANSNLSRSGRRIFLSRVNFVCWLLFSVHSTPVVLQWHVKDPGHSAKSIGGRLHLDMHTSLTQWSQSRRTMPQAQCGNLSGIELTCNSSGNTRPGSSQLTELQWTDPGLQSEISVCNLIST